MVEALIRPDEFEPISDVVYHDEDLILRHPPMRLVWEMGGDSGVLYESEPLPTPDPDGWNGDRVNGPPQVNDRYVVFYTNDTPEVASPWQIWAWDRRRPDEPPWQIGALPEGAAMDGFTYEKLRGNRVVWSQPTPDGSREIIAYDLDERSATVLASGVVYRPQFIEDDVVVWQALRPGREYFTTLTGVNLVDGETWELPHQLTDIDMGLWGYVADETIMALVREPAGNSDRHGLVVWREPWPAPVEIERTEQAALIDGAEVLTHGDLFAYLVWGDGNYTVRVLNTVTGVVHEVYRDWAVPSFVGDSLRLTRLLDRETLTSGSVEIPVAEFESARCGG